MKKKITMTLCIVKKEKLSGVHQKPVGYALTCQSMLASIHKSVLSNL